MSERVNHGRKNIQEEDGADHVMGEVENGEKSEEKKEGKEVLVVDEVSDLKAGVMVVGEGEEEESEDNFLEFNYYLSKGLNTFIIS